MVGKTIIYMLIALFLFNSVMARTVWVWEEANATYINNTIYNGTGLFNETNGTVHLTNSSHNFSIGSNNSHGYNFYVEGDKVRMNVSDWVLGNGTENTNYGNEFQLDIVHLPLIFGLGFGTLAFNINTPFLLRTNLSMFQGGQYYVPCDYDQLGIGLGVCGGGQIQHIFMNHHGGNVTQIIYNPDLKTLDNHFEIQTFYSNLSMTDGGSGSGNIIFNTNNRGNIWRGSNHNVSQLFDGTNNLKINMSSYDPYNDFVKFSADGHKGVGINLSSGEHPRGSIDIQRSGAGGYENKVALAMGSHREDYVCINWYDADFVWSSTSQRTYLCCNAGGGTGNPNNCVWVNATGHIITMMDRDGRVVYDHEGSATRPTESIQAGRNFSVASNYFVVDDGEVGIGVREPLETLDVRGNVSIQDNLTVNGNIYLPHYNGTTLERGCILWGENRNTGFCAESGNFFSVIVNGARVLFCQTGGCQFGVNIIPTSTLTRYLGAINRLWLKIYGYDIFAQNTIGIDAINPSANLDVNGTSIFRDDINQSGGNATINIPYAQMGEKFGHTTPLIISFPSSGVYYNVTNMTYNNGSAFNYTNANQTSGGSYLTNLISGCFLVTSHFSGKGSVAGGEYGIVAVKNFDKTLYEENCYVTVDGTTNYDVHTITCVMCFEFGDTFNIQVEDETNPTKDINIASHNVVLTRIREIE